MENINTNGFEYLIKKTWMYCSVWAAGLFVLSVSLDNISPSAVYRLSGASNGERNLGHRSCHCSRRWQGNEIAWLQPNRQSSPRLTLLGTWPSRGASASRLNARDYAPPIAVSLRRLCIVPPFCRCARSWTDMSFFRVAHECAFGSGGESGHELENAGDR
jgi:hypothetical protein